MISGTEPLTGGSPVLAVDATRFAHEEFGPVVAVDATRFAPEESGQVVVDVLEQMGMTEFQPKATEAVQANTIVRRRMATVHQRQCGVGAE